MILLAYVQTAETIQAVSELLSSFNGWGGIGAVIVVVAAMPAAAVIGLAMINARSQARLIEVLEKNSEATFELASAAAASKAGVDELKENHRELAAKLNGIGRNVELTLEHARSKNLAPSGGGK